MKTKSSLFALLLISAVNLHAQNTMNIYQNNGTVLQIPLNSIDSITYTLSGASNLATLTTVAISAITNTSASSGGVISSDGGTPVTQRGICWSTSSNPTIADNTTNNGSGLGNFTGNLTGLSSNTTYYVRAYAINGIGVAYGNQVSFTTTGGGNGILNPNLSYGSMTDQDGNTYATIIIGTQEWMAENLRVTTYANGDPIPNITDQNQWNNLTSGAWAHYNNDTQYENPYGKLYNWYAVNDIRYLCPNGWHIPSDAEWNTLINYLDPNANGGNTIPNYAGGEMKSTGTQYWQSPNTSATNLSGFSGLPGGSRTTSSFTVLGVNAYYWSSSTSLNSSVHAIARSLHPNTTNVHWGGYGKVMAFSVRCLRD